MTSPTRPEPFDSDPAVRELCRLYADLRIQCARIEDFIESAGRDQTISPEEVKRLDKAITVAKVGAKIIKKVLRRRGAIGNLKDAA